MKRVLIVDDEEDIGTLMSLMLRSLGFEVEFVNNSISATSALEQREFDYIFLDLNLGETRGLDLIPKIRESQKNVQVNVISAYDDAQTLAEVEAAGVANFIQKPFKRKEILEIVDKAS